MKKHDLWRLSDDDVVSGFAALVGEERPSEQNVRGFLVEMKRRALEIPAGFPPIDLDDIEAYVRNPVPVPDGIYPLPSGRFLLRAMVRKATHDLMQELQASLGATKEEVLELALDKYLAKLKARKARRKRPPLQ